MNIKLKAFFVLAAIAIAFIPQAGAQNTNRTPGYVISSGFQVIPNVEVPGGLNGVVAVAAGYYHGLALDRRGRSNAERERKHGLGGETGVLQQLTKGEF